MHSWTESSVRTHLGQNNPNEAYVSQVVYETDSGYCRLQQGLQHGGSGAFRVIDEQHPCVQAVHLSESAATSWQTHFDNVKRILPR